MTSLLACQVAILMSASPTSNVLDNFAYRSTAQLQAAWQASEGTPALTVQAEGTEDVTSIPAPFADHSDLKRVVIDRRGQWDLSAPAFFALEVHPEQAAAFGHVTLYFHSKQGWYGQGKALGASQWQRIVFPKSAFTTEQDPSGWDKVDGIRIALWRGSATAEGTFLNSRVTIRNLVTGWHRAAILMPPVQTAEARAGRECGARIERMLAAAGVTCDVIAQQDLSLVGLGRRRVLILPYNPTLSAADCTVLEQWVTGGGKLFACYSSAPSLLQLLKVKDATYYRPERPGDLAYIQMQNANLPGLPKRIEQRSWNIYSARPADASVKVVGQWLNADGKPSGHAALLLGPTGAYFSHVILDDDPEAKRAMLLAILGQLDPGIWAEAATSAMEQAEQIGHCQSAAALATELQGQLTSDLAAKLRDADKITAEASSDLQRGDGFAALNAARRARELRVNAYLRAQPSPTVEGRAWWNHSGTGAYPGDWDRTCRELAAAGFNMVIPNMLWGGVAHYNSDVLPRSAIVKQYGDQIQQCVAAAKKYGIEVHVWKVNWNLGHAVPKELVAQLRKAGRLQVTQDGEPMNWLNPAHPENQKLELESLLEIVRKCDVDGIHFDYIRYPNGNCDFSDYSHHKFEADTSIHVANWPQDCFSGPLKKAYTDWRCQQITRLVAAVHREAKKLRPTIKISAAVFGSYPSCRESVAQDWPLWIRNGYLDFVCPMDYTASDDSFRRLITSQRELVGGRIPIYPGIGATASRVRLTPDRVVGQIAITRQLQVDGFTIFNLSESTAQRILPAVEIGAGRNPARPKHRVAVHSIH